MYRRGKNFKGSDGRMSKARVAWARVVIGLFDLRQFLPEDEAEDTVDIDGAPLRETQIGANVRLGIPSGGGRIVTLNLTALTEPELRALQDLLELAFDLALPVVKQRDEAARDAAAQGDDSHSRIYRQLPEFVVRHGQIATYNQGVWSRPADVPEGRGSGSPAGGVRRTGDVVADEAPEGAGPTDDGETAD